MNKKNNLLLPIVMLLSGITYTAHSAQPAAAAKATADMTAPQTQASAQSNSASVTIMFGGQPVTAPQWVFEQFAAIENYLEDTQNWLFGGHILTEPQRAAIEQEDRLELTKMCLHDDGTHALDIHNIALSRFLDEVCKKDAHGASHAFAPAHVFQLLLNFVEYTQAPYMFSEKRYDFSTEHIKTLIAQLNQLNVNDLAAFVRIAKNLCLKEKPFAALEDYLQPLIDRPDFSETFLAGDQNALQLAFDCDEIGFKKIMPHTLMLASGEDSLTLDASSGKLFGNHQRTVSCSAFSPDGTLIATGSDDYRVKVSNAQNGQLLYTINHNGTVNSADFSPDGSLIATGSWDNTVKVSNARTGQLVYTIHHTSYISPVAFSPDGSLIATGLSGNTVKVSNAHTGQPLYTITHTHTGGINSVSFSPDGTSLLVNDRLIPAPPITHTSAPQSFLARALKSKDPKLTFGQLPKNLYALFFSLPYSMQNKLITITQSERAIALNQRSL